ncbi:hypothetical protein, partial [Akkermansia muciniphila]|uniref:hypothetical protein n=1 Tax=Akkermansia muciniphila TaxID=239935 RepID=UPI00210946ED
MDKKSGGKSATANKKPPQKNTPAQQDGFPPVKRQSQMKVEIFIPALFIQLLEVTREKIYQRGRRQ